MHSLAEGLILATISGVHVQGKGMGFTLLLVYWTGQNALPFLLKCHRSLHFLRLLLLALLFCFGPLVVQFSD
jgi:hypothetical protein